MIKEIIIDSSSTQTRVAIAEDSKLVDFFVENPEKRRTVGDIYLGRVARVLPGIKAAFIDIGQKHDAFLHFSDIGNRLVALQGIFNEDGNDDDLDDESDDDDESLQNNEKPAQTNEQNQVVAKLQKGQEI